MSLIISLENLVFKGTLPTTVTQYVTLPVGPNGQLFFDVGWKDATSSATITLETTGSPESVVGDRDAGSAWHWKTESGVTITGPAGAAAGSTKVHVSNLWAPRARLKIVTAAACDFEIYAKAS